MTVRYFTVEQANRTLPLVKRVVADIVTDYARWKEHVRRFELASGTASREETPEQHELRSAVESLAARIDGYLEELNTIGCVFKGFEDGLVDFYAKRDGRDVFLCWRLGETAVEHWHDVDTGFAGRQRLVPETISGDTT